MKVPPTSAAATAGREERSPRSQYAPPPLRLRKAACTGSEHARVQGVCVLVRDRLGQATCWPRPLLLLVLFSSLSPPLPSEVETMEAERLDRAATAAAL